MKGLYEQIHNVNKNEEISATITMPVNFSKYQQIIIEKAARDAGFVVNAMITEPFAAIFYLMNDYWDEIENNDNHNVLVFDFGGGTLDLCLIEIKKKNHKIKINTQATVGISYGGNNISEDIINEILKKKFPKEINETLYEIENEFHKMINQYNMRYEIDMLKEMLFGTEDETEAEMVVKLYSNDEGKEKRFDFGEISIWDIYQMFEDQKMDKQIFSLLQRLFEESESLIPEDITEVFFTGGSSSVSYFRDIVQKFFEKNGHTDVKSIFQWNDEMDIDERRYKAVSGGAVIYHEMMENETCEIKDKIPFLVYTKTENGKITTKISMDSVFKDMCSPLAPISKKMKIDKKVAVYQTIFGEDNKEVFLGDILLSDEMISEGALYRLSVDKQRNIQVEIGYLEDEFYPLYSVELDIMI